MVTTLKISRKVKDKVERFLAGYYGNEYEWGGYLIKRREIINTVVIVPNNSPTPKSTYVFPPLAPVMAEKFTRMKRGYASIAAEWHSHPHPCIMSTGDTCYSRNNNVIEVMITPLEKGWASEFEWYACKGIAPVRIEFVGRVK